jgi:hypothetical protein
MRISMVSKRVVADGREDWRTDWSPSGPDPDWEREEAEPGYDPGPGDSFMEELHGQFDKAWELIPSEFPRMYRNEVNKDASRALLLIKKWRDSKTPVSNELAEKAYQAAKSAFEVVESIMYDDFPDIAQEVVDKWYEFYLMFPTPDIDDEPW